MAFKHFKISFKSFTTAISGEGEVGGMVWNKEATKKPSEIKYFVPQHIRKNECELLTLEQR